MNYKELMRELDSVSKRFDRVFVIRKKKGGYALLKWRTTAATALGLGYSIITYNRDENGVFQRSFA